MNLKYPGFVQSWNSPNDLRTFYNYCCVSARSNYDILVFLLIVKTTYLKNDLKIILVGFVSITPGIYRIHQQFSPSIIQRKFIELYNNMESCSKLDRFSNIKKLLRAIRLLVSSVICQNVIISNSDRTIDLQYWQGIVTDGEGSVRLTSSLRQLVL